MLKHAWGTLPNSMMHMDLVQDRGDVAPWEHEKSSTFSAGQRTVLSFRRTPQLLAQSSPITCCREHLCCSLYRCPRLGFEEAAEKASVCVSLFEGMRITREGKISKWISWDWRCSHYCLLTCLNCLTMTFARSFHSIFALHASIYIYITLWLNIRLQSFV